MSPVVEVLVAIAAVLTAITVIYRRGVRPFVHAVREGLEGVQYVRGELEFDGGVTARDAIKRIDDEVKGLHDRMTELETNQSVMIAEMSGADEGDE